MKKVIVVLIAGLISAGAYAGTAKVAAIQPLHEGVLVLDAHAGQHVKKGQLLFHIDPTLNKMLALQAKSTLKIAKETYARDKKLSRTHIVSNEALATAKDAYIQAYAGYKTALYNLKRNYSYAPFSGTVTKIDFYTGSAVGDASTVMTITENIRKHK
jgi:membrane fusion protein, multidrug efflux system